MEQVHRGEVARGQAEAQEWVELGEEGWVAPERVRVRMENASVLNAGQASPMKWPFLVIIGNVQKAGQKW
jgi:hypothetical protein